MADIVVRNGQAYLVEGGVKEKPLEEAITGASVFVHPEDLEFLILELQRHAIFLEDQLLRQRHEDKL